MYRKDMDKYKEKLTMILEKGIQKEGFSHQELQDLENEFEKIIQEIYEHGYEDGTNEREHEQEKEPVPWEDLD